MQIRVIVTAACKFAVNLRVAFVCAGRVQARTLTFLRYLASQYFSYGTYSELLTGRASGLPMTSGAQVNTSKVIFKRDIQSLFPEVIECIHL